MLLPLGGRFRGVAGVLRRTGQFVKSRLQRCNACILRSDVGVRQSQPGGQRRNQRVLFGMAQLGGNRKPRHPLFRINSAVTASRIF